MLGLEQGWGSISFWESSEQCQPRACCAVISDFHSTTRNLQQHTQSGHGVGEQPAPSLSLAQWQYFTSIPSSLVNLSLDVHGFVLPWSTKLNFLIIWQDAFVLWMLLGPGQIKGYSLGSYAYRQIFANSQKVQIFSHLFWTRCLTRDEIQDRCSTN